MQIIIYFRYGFDYSLFVIYQKQYLWLLNRRLLEETPKLCRRGDMILGRRSLWWSLQWRHNDYDGAIITSLPIAYSTVYSGADQSKHQSSPSLALCAKNSPVTGEFPTQRASNAENVSIRWRHHVYGKLPLMLGQRWAIKSSRTVYVSINPCPNPR